MARLVSRFLRRSAASDDAARNGGPPRPPRQAASTPGRLRRERRALLRLREERIRDLGGLMLEMFRRDQFNQQLVSERCGELLGLEARLEELDRLLDAITRRLPGRSAKCACGAPFVFGAHFCANCGRPVGAAVVSCEGCGGPLPAAARFCPACGRSAEPGEEQRPEPVETAGGGEREARDPWEE